MTEINSNTTSLIPQEKSFLDVAAGLWDATLAKITAFVVSMLGSNYSTMAGKAQKFVNANILFSSTFPNRNIHFRKNKARSFHERFSGIDNGVKQVRSLIKEARRSNFDKGIAIGKTAIKYSLGNCMEMAAAAFVYILKAHPEIKVDIFHIEGGDHCFLVIGRDFNSDPTDPKTWGAHALICDPWSKKSFPASKIKKLKDFSGKVTFDGNPVVRDLDLNTQTLALWTSNQFTAKDLKYLAGPNPSSDVVERIEALAPLLQNFHQEKNLAKKQEAAKAIQKFLEETPFSQTAPLNIAFHNVLTDLYDQLDFFLTNCTSS
jgi:hypothetical protein